MEIHLVLVDDWELRGNGSGDPRKIQFEPMRQLCSIYEDHGIRGTFNAEVMQQLHHLRAGERHAQLAEVAGEWEEIVRETYRRGHDVQLHVHPQWRGATFDGQAWSLSGEWNLLRHPTPEIRKMLGEAKDYLEQLLRPVNPDYRCMSFRSGAWCIAPHEDALAILSELGIVFDMSICAGLHYDLKHVRLDYRHVEEPFLPFYPAMGDARRVSDKIEPIVCCPTLSFTYTTGMHRRLLAAVTRRVARGYHASRFEKPSVNVANDYQYWNPENGSKPREMPTLWRRLRSLVAAGSTSTHVVADLANMTFVQMSDMTDEILRRASRVDHGPIPVILENHTKDIGNFEPIERFCRLLSRRKDIRVVTAADVARGIREGRYAVRTAPRLGEA